MDNERAAGRLLDSAGSMSSSLSRLRRSDFSRESLTTDGADCNSCACRSKCPRLRRLWESQLLLHMISMPTTLRNKQTVCLYELTGMIAELARRSSLSTNVRSTKMAAPNGTTTWPRNRGSSCIERMGAAMISCCRASGCVSLTRCSNSE